MLFDDTFGTANYLYLWVGTKAAGSTDFLARNGIAAASGSLYAWKATDIANTQAALNGVNLNTPVNGSWVQLGTGAQIAALSTGTDLRSLASAQGAMAFVRIEDGDVDPGTGRKVAFNTTGGSGDDLYGNTNIIDLTNAFDANGQVVSGATTALRVLVDTDRLTGVARQSGVRNPDNLAWSANGRLYIQEDRSLPAGVVDGSFGSEEASIWSVDVLTGTTVRWAQIDRGSVPTAYGQSDSAPSDVGNWESSGVIDVSAIYGTAAGSYFLSAVQAHSLTNGNLNGNLNTGGGNGNGNGNGNGAPQTNGNLGFMNGGTGNVGAFNGLGNTSSTSGNNNTGALNGNGNGSTNNGNGNLGSFNGNLNGVGSSGSNGTTNGNENIGALNGNFNGGFNR
jgi:hypothetical protein